MTTIFLVRHAEAVLNVETEIRPLTKKGLADRKKINDFLFDKNIDIVVSSDYRRCVETLDVFAKINELKIKEVVCFRERKRNSHLHLLDSDFKLLMNKLFSDFNYIPEIGEESMSELQTRSINAIQDLLEKCKGKNIVIGTHIITMHTILMKYDNCRFGFDSFCENLEKMPWIVKMCFEGDVCKEISEEDLLL